MPLGDHLAELRTRLVRDFAEMYPERFNNKTNGVTPRRWLLLANPWLSATIREAIGDGWVSDLGQLSRLKPMADDRRLREQFAKAKQEAKQSFAGWLQTTHGAVVDPHSSCLSSSP